MGEERGLGKTAESAVRRPCGGPLGPGEDLRYDVIGSIQQGFTEDKERAAPLSGAPL